MPASDKVRRCFWADGDPLLATYHDEEWGVPVHDDRRWFEKLVLDGAQAGLSWLTILRKREGYRAAFAGFDPARVARFTARDQARLMKDPGIVRNAAKIDPPSATRARSWPCKRSRAASTPTSGGSSTGGRSSTGSAAAPTSPPARRCPTPSRPT